MVNREHGGRPGSRQETNCSTSALKAHPDAVSTALRIASVIIVAKAGRERAKGFRTKAAGKAWLDEIVSAQVTGTYIDPESGKMTFASYYREWSSHQLWESGTRKAMDLAVNSGSSDSSVVRLLM